MGEKGKVDLNYQFSIEIIFKPDDIPAVNGTKDAVLLSNSMDTSGFIIKIEG
jgi:hypothetical protein